MFFSIVIIDINNVFLSSDLQETVYMAQLDQRGPLIPPNHLMFANSTKHFMD